MARSETLTRGGSSFETKPRGAVGARAPRNDGSALTTVIADELLARISRGTYAVGTRLSQERLAREFGVSRTPIREALRVLQTSGLIQFEQNRGATVRVPSPLDVREAYLVRAELEGIAAELAAQWMRDDELQQLREAEARFRAAALKSSGYNQKARKPKRPQWVDANELFHRIVHQAARNQQLCRTIAFLDRSFPRALSWAALHDNASRLQLNASEHQAILLALEERNATEARRNMTLHVRHAGELVVMWVEERQRAAPR